MFTLRPVVASRSFVRLARTIKRQFYTTGGDKLYPTERNQVANVDVISRNHDHLYLLLGDLKQGTPTQALQLVDLPGYKV